MEHIHRASETVVAASATSAIFLPADPNRLCVVISPGKTNRITISRLNPAVIDLGLTIPPGVQPLILRVWDVGTWIQEGLWIVAAGAEKIGVVEVLCPCRRDQAIPW